MKSDGAGDPVRVKRPRPTRPWPRRFVSRLLLVLAAALALLWATGILPRANDAASLMWSLAADEQPVGILRQPVGIPVAGRLSPGDLYAADPTAPLPGLVLLPGASPGGKDEPRLVRFAEQLAVAGFRVLVPDSESLRRLQVSADDALLVAGAARLLGGPEGKVGVAAISYAAAPAILAALDPAARERIAFVLAIGGYYDGTALVTYFTTGYFREPGETAWRHQEPNAYGKWVFVLSNAPRLENAKDGALLGGIAYRKLQDLNAPVEDLVSRLGPEGRSVYALAENRDPARVPALLEALPPRVLAELAALDLARLDLSPLAARLILIHGRDDPIVPYSESLALAQAAPEGLSEVHLLDSLLHVELSVASLDDGWKLFRAAYAFVTERDRLPALPPPDLR